jgi:hypothetical protein
MENIFPLSYSICDEYVVNTVPDKKHLWAEVIPGIPETYRFGVEDEAEYQQSYRDSQFALTFKKGGWDCLRHYEILAGGCIPVFREGQNCPEKTMTNFPKELIIRANKELIPWKNTQEYKDKYAKYATELLEYTRANLTTSAAAKYFLNIVHPMKPINNLKILFIACHEGVNYSREFLFIGLNRLCKAEGGECIMYPRLDFLYDDFDVAHLKNKHGLGYCYSRKLHKTLEKEKNPLTEEEVRNTICSHYWDYVVFAKVGPDECGLGTIPHMPLWDIVYRNYTKDEIVFLYGGDGQQNMTIDNRYSVHLKYHSQFGKCFVRELA